VFNMHASVTGAWPVISIELATPSHFRPTSSSRATRSTHRGQGPFYAVAMSSGGPDRGCRADHQHVPDGDGFPDHRAKTFVSGCRLRRRFISSPPAARTNPQVVSQFLVPANSDGLRVEERDSLACGPPDRMTCTWM